MSKYVLVDYEHGVNSEEPRIAFRTKYLQLAEQKFEQLKQINVDRCVVLYDTDTDEVIQLVMLCKLIYFVMAVELARNEGSKFKRAAKFVGTLATKGASEVASRAEACAGAVLGSAAGVYDRLSGAIRGFIAGGPVGACHGDVFGSSGIAGGASQFVPADCGRCNGVGLDENGKPCNHGDNYD